MKPFYFCALALAAAPLFGGKLIEMDSTDLSNNQTTNRRVMIENDKLAVVDGRSKMIFRSDGGRPRVQVVDLQRNQYMEIDEATIRQLTETMNNMAKQMDEAFGKMDPQMRAMMEKMMKGKMPAGAAAAQAPAPVTFARQGSGNVAGFSCTRYTGTQNGQTTMELCASTAAALNLAASDYAVFEDLKEFSKGLQQAVQNSPFGGAIVSNAMTTAGYEGFPVEQTVYLNGKAATKDTLKSIKDQAFSDADFSVGNAKKTELAMPANTRKR